SSSLTVVRWISRLNDFLANQGQEALLKALRSSFPRLKNFLKDVEVLPEGTLALRPRHRVVSSNVREMMASGNLVILVVVCLGMNTMVVFYNLVIPVVVYLSANTMVVFYNLVILVAVYLSANMMVGFYNLVILVVVFPGMNMTVVFGMLVILKAVSFTVKAMMVINVMVIFGKCLVSQWRFRSFEDPINEVLNNMCTLCLPQLEGRLRLQRSQSERLLETLAEGMQQLQKAQLDQFERAEKRKNEEPPEQCKPGTTSLPSLPPPSGHESAVALQDWIEVIDGPLRDISDSSSWWWDAVKERAQKGYQLWVASGPYERLSLKPPTADDLEQGRFSRLSARTAGMMLQAMTEGVRAEMVARAITRSPMALLFRLHTMYQPGGESEKAYILQYLVNPPKAASATDLVSVLRQWERLLLRADNLHIAKPDPSLLVRGLNGLVSDGQGQGCDVPYTACEEQAGSGCESYVGVGLTVASTLEGGVREPCEWSSLCGEIFCDCDRVTA
ncbi:unnamed protein product, partial [Symbiodinium sp. CCMP2456]